MSDHHQAFRVMVVDDSTIVRGFVTRMLDADPDVSIVASVSNGELALARLAEANPEVIVLDIEMPVMDGLSALPKILDHDPTLRVIMASTLTKRNADISFEAMALGAVDYVPKPSSSKELSTGQNFKSELLEKVKAWGDQRRKMLGPENGEGALKPPYETVTQAQQTPSGPPGTAPHRPQRKQFSAEKRPRPVPPRPQMPLAVRAKPAATPPPRPEPEAPVAPPATDGKEGKRKERGRVAAKSVSAAPAGGGAVSGHRSAKTARQTAAIRRPADGKAPAVNRAAPASPQPPAHRRAKSRGGPIRLRPAPDFAPEVLAIGSSTGGPQALFAVMSALQKTRLPIFITQHMPATFTTILAEHISRSSGFDCREGVDGEQIAPGRVYLAPGEYHMVVEQKGAQRLIRLTQGPPENFCRPAVDPMLRSLVKCYGNKILTTILTGMGQDGMLGGEAVVKAGGAVIAQDEASSVVWGMPGAAAGAGICSAVLPINQIGDYINRIILRRGK